MAVYTGARTYQEVDHSDTKDSMMWRFEWWLFAEINAYAWDLTPNPYRENQARYEARLFKSLAKQFLAGR